MGDRLKELRERSQKRRQLLAQQFGVDSPEGLSKVLKSKQDQNEDFKLQQARVVSSLEEKRNVINEDEVFDTSKKRKLENQAGGVDELSTEDDVYTDSSKFLKGTQSANPHNDYCQNFVDSGERPQNFIRDVGLANRFEEYPKLRELIKLKDELVQKTATPPMYLHADLETFEMEDLQSQFDVIVIEPPLEEYRAQGLTFDKYWSWDEIGSLEIEKVAASRSFIWMWCGSSEGLDMGRECLRKWGFRRCEDICWIKTNIKNPGHIKNLGPRQIFQRTKEHCLMGIKGTVRRSTDGDFIHANVDIDLIIDEEPEYGSKMKPVELFHIAEHFCLGRRRLHVFGRDNTIRPGWLTIGPEVTSSNFDADAYNNYFRQSAEGFTTGCTDEIERLRPKSPAPKNKSGEGSRGRGDNRGGMSRGGLSRGGSSRGGMPPRGGRGGFRGRGGFGRGRGSYRGGAQGSR